MGTKGPGGTRKAGPDLTHWIPPHRVIPNLFPKYIRAPNGPEANPVKQLQPSECVWGKVVLGHGLCPRRGCGLTVSLL